MVFLWLITPGMRTITVGHHGDAPFSSLPRNLLRQGCQHLIYKMNAL